MILLGKVKVTKEGWVLPSLTKLRLQRGNGREQKWRGDDLIIALSLQKKLVSNDKAIT